MVDGGAVDCSSSGVIVATRSDVEELGEGGGDGWCVWVSLDSFACRSGVGDTRGAFSCCSSCC